MVNFGTVKVEVSPGTVGAKVTSPPRCFLLMTSQKDMRGLLEHGEVVIIHGSERRPGFWSPEFMDNTMEKMAERGYQHGHDFVVAAGPLVPLVKVLCSLSARHSTEPRLLLFDAARQSFVTS